MQYRQRALRRARHSQLRAVPGNAFASGVPAQTASECGAEDDRVAPAFIKRCVRQFTT